MAWPQNLSNLPTSHTNATVMLGTHPSAHNDLSAAINRIEAELRTGAGVYNAKHFGAVGNGTTDDSGAIQEALNVASAAGGTVYLPPAVYAVDTTLTVGGHTTLRGAWSGQWESGLDLTRGSILKWTGGNGGTVLRVFNAGLVTVDGLCVHLNNTTGSTGILLDSANAPATQNVSLWHFTVYGGTSVDYRTASTVGVQIGTSGLSGGGGPAGYQTDCLSLRHGRLQSVTTCIAVNSNNALDAGVVEHVIGAYTACFFRSVQSTFQAVRSCFWGFEGDVVGRGIEIEGSHSVFLVEQCQAEGGAAGTTMLRVTSGAGGLATHPITLLSNHCDHPVTISSIRRLVTVGNHFNDDVTLGTSGVLCTSVGDTFATGKGFVSTGGGHVERPGGFHNASAQASRMGPTLTVVAGTTITPTNGVPVQPLTAAGAVTVTAVPSLAAVGVADGQALRLINLGSNNIVLQDRGVLTGSNLALVGASITLTPLDSVDLMYSNAAVAWVQVGPVVVVA